MKTVVVIQSNYIPWKGYFDLIHDADDFVFYDDVQYTKNDWRNRNQIKGPNGVFWLTIPISKEAVKLRIDQVGIPDMAWQSRHWAAIEQCYSKAPHFSQYADFFRQVYCQRQWGNLSDLNRHLTQGIADYLGIRTKYHQSSSFQLVGDRTDRLIGLLTSLKADRYISGPSARAYIEPEKFQQAGIELVFKDYDYPEYPQLWGTFVHNVSVIDLLFNVGERAPQFIWGGRSP